MMTRDFLKSIFAGSSKLMKLKDVKFIQVGKYDELAISKVYHSLLDLDGMKPYFPSAYPKGRKCDRDYMWNIANSLYPDVVKQLVEHALS